MVESEYLRVREFLIPSYMDCEEADVLYNLRSGHAQLWPGKECAVVTQCIRNPPSLYVWLAGGNIGEIVSLIPGVAAWARAQGCEFASVDGRAGWKRILAPHGFVEHEGELRKAL